MILRKSFFVLLFLLSCGGDSNEGQSQVSLDGEIKKVTKALSACDKHELNLKNYIYPYRCSKYFGGIFIFTDELAPTQACIKLTQEIIKGYDQNICNESESEYLAASEREYLERFKYHEKKLLREIEKNKVSWRAGRNMRDCDQRKSHLTYSELSLLTFNDDCSYAKLDMSSFVDLSFDIFRHYKGDEPELCKGLRKDLLTDEEIELLERPFEHILVTFKLMKNKKAIESFKDTIEPYGIYTYSDNDSFHSTIFNVKYKEISDDLQNFTTPSLGYSRSIGQGKYYTMDGRLSVSVWLTNYGACKFAQDGVVDTKSISFEKELNKLLEVNIHKVLIP